MRRALVIAVIASSAGCKTDDAKPTPPAPVQRPAPRTPEPPKAEGLLDWILGKELQLANAKVLAPLRAFDDRGQAQQSWCMAGSDAQAIASEMTKAMIAAGWGTPRSRGTADRASVEATLDDKGEYVATISIGGRDPTCDGLVATALYHSTTITIPPVPEGDRVR